MSKKESLTGTTLFCRLGVLKSIKKELRTKPIASNQRFGALLNDFYSFSFKILLTSLCTSAALYPASDNL